MKIKKWPRFSDFFSFYPPADQHGAYSIGTLNDEDQDPDATREEDSSELFESELSAQNKENWQKIRFDNSIRLLISIPTYLSCFALWMGNVIPSIIPMTVVFSGFAVIQLAVTWFFMNNLYARKFDYLMCGFDLVAMSAAIYFTGGAASPLYFIYFIPLVIHAFHRDWALVLFNGIGGSVLYALAILNSLAKFSPVELTNLGTRLFFMFLTLGIVSFAVNLLRKKDAGDRLRLGRLKALTLVGRRLNKVADLSELPVVLANIIKLVNQGMGPAINPWTRFMLFREDASILRSVEDPSDKRPDLKQELAAHTCPAMKSNKAFVLENIGTSMECPVENFSFGSHACIPVVGTENESFGILFSASALPNAFHEEELQFLQYIARSLALSIQRLQRMEELHKAVEMNSCVMAAYIGSSRSLSDTCKAILEGTATILKADQVKLMLWEPESGYLKTFDIYGPHTLSEKEFTTQMGEGIAGRALEQRTPYWTTDVHDDPGVAVHEKSVKALVCLPMATLKGEPLGVITAIRMEQLEGFSKTDIDTACTYATRASLAIENARLHQKEKDRTETILQERIDPNQKAA